MSIDLEDPRLTAFALGELSATERAEFERLLETSPVARRVLAEIMETASLLTEELQKEPCPAAASRNSNLKTEIPTFAASTADEIRISTESRPLRRQSVRGAWIGWVVAASLVAGVVGPFVYNMVKHPANFAHNGDSNDDGSTVAPDFSGMSELAKNDRSKKSTKPDAAAATDSDDATPPDSMVTETTPPEMPADESSTKPDAAEKPATIASNDSDTSTAPGAGAAAIDASKNAPKNKRGQSPSALVDDVSWIDSLAAQKWSENGIKASAVASDGEFIRRAYLDIVGHTPPADKASAYIASKDKEKKAKLILELLDNESYSKYWATIWSNLLIGRRSPQNVDKDGLTKYLRDCFAENKPWNQMVYELVTATGGSNPQSNAAGVRFNGAVNFLLAQLGDRTMPNVPATGFTARLFLGVQVQCTQCHDHPFNDRKQEQFYSMNAFFQGMRQQIHNTQDDTGRNRRVFTELQETTPRGDLFIRFDKRNGLVAVIPPGLPNGQQFLEVPDETTLRGVLGTYITSPENPSFAKAIVNRMWSHFLGRGIVHPADDLGEHNPPSNPQLIDDLAKHFTESKYDLKRLITWITLSQPYALSSQTNSTNREDDIYFSHFPLKQMSPEQVFDSLMVATKADQVGSKNVEDTPKLRDEMLRQFTVVFSNDENTEADTFNGTVPQALFLMNGGLMSKAISFEKGSFLHDRVVDLVKKGNKSAEVPLLNDIYLAALSRYPTTAEQRLAGQVIQSTLRQTTAKDRTEAYVQAFQDVSWALLNSNEFVLNH